MNCEPLENRHLLGFAEIALNVCQTATPIFNEIIDHPWPYAATSVLIYINLYNGFNEGHAAEDLPLSHFAQKTLTWSDHEIITSIMFALFSESLRCNPFQSFIKLSNLFPTFPTIPSYDHPHHNTLLSLLGSSLVFISMQTFGSIVGYAASMGDEAFELLEHVGSLTYCDC